MAPAIASALPRFDHWVRLQTTCRGQAAAFGSLDEEVEAFRRAEGAQVRDQRLHGGARHRRLAVTGRALGEHSCRGEQHRERVWVEAGRSPRYGSSESKNRTSSCSKLNCAIGLKRLSLV